MIHALSFDDTIAFDSGFSENPWESKSKLFEAARAELKDTATLVIVVTGVLNDLVRAHRKDVPQGLLLFLPGTLVAARMPLLSRDGTSLDSSTAEALTMFEATLNLGRQQLQRAVAAPVAEVRSEDLNVLADTWRCLCDLSIDLIRDLQPHDTNQFLEETSERCGMLELLNEARNGEYLADLNALTQISPSGFRQRPKRFMLNVSATLSAPGGRHPVLVRDASTGGLGIHHSIRLVEGQPVKVTLACGRSFEGKITWASNRRAGIQFQAPLSESDVLFSA